MKKILMIVFLIFLLNGCTAKPPIILNTTKPTFKWSYPTEGTYAERFKVEVYKNNQIDWEYETPQNITTIIFSDIEINDVFKIRVFGIDKKNRLGKPSQFSKEFKPLITEEK